MNSALPDLLFLLIVIYVAVLLGIYIWYAVALSKLFPKLGAEGWKGWVPILNEATILERGGISPWLVLLNLVPLANLVGLYFRIVAVHRIGLHFGKGSGMVVLGVFLPPVWAMLVASPDENSPDLYGERIQGMGLAPVAQTTATGPLAQSYDAPPAQHAAVAPREPVVTSFAPPPPPPPAPKTPEPNPIADSAGPAEPAGRPAVPTPIENPWAPKVEPSTGAAQAVTVPPPLTVPPAPPAPPPAAMITPASPADPVSLPDPPTAESAPPTPPALAVGYSDDDELVDRTVVVNRRPLARWSIVTDEGVVVPVSSESVILGRKPVSKELAVEAVPIPDTTRTLSKNHARLDLSDGVWTITDLNSTNGVIVVEPDGTERLLDPGASAVISDRFELGTVGMRLTFADASD